jgi:hypothetical protein
VKRTEIQGLTATVRIVGPDVDLLVLDDEITLAELHAAVARVRVRKRFVVIIGTEGQVARLNLAAMAGQPVCEEAGE